MNKKQKKMLVRIIVSAAMMIILKFTPVEGILRFLLYLIPYFIIGYDVLKKAGKGILNRQVFDENFLMAVATIGAMAVALYNGSESAAALGLAGESDYTEAIAVMLFYQIGELFQSYAVGKSRRNISELMDIRPDYANIETDGELTQVDPDEVKIGTVIVVKPGEKVPIDGIIVEGVTSLNTSALTGESLPREAKTGDEVISGCINMNGLIRIRTTKEFGESTVSKILDLVENASSKKSRSENFISKFARYYTPIVVIAAVVLAILPPIILGGNWASWIKRACIFLVISCPCALVISVPLSFFGGIGAASKNGILIKGSNYIEALSEMKVIVFDKTGTITKGEFKVQKLIPGSGDVNKGELIEWAAYAEGYSDHPIAKSIKDAYGSNIDINLVDNAEEISGHGIKVNVKGKEVLAGNEKLMKLKNIKYQPCTEAGTVVYVAVEGKYTGCVLIADGIKEGAGQAFENLKKLGVRKTVMLTGDRKDVGEAVASELHIDEVHTELLPADKVTQVEIILGESDDKNKVAFVGDGINDAPVLMRSDIGIAMGSMGSDAAIEAADIVLMDDDIRKIPLVMRIASKTMGIVRQNIVFALGVKLLVLILGALGVANMWEAVFADVGVSVIAILNAMRTLNIKE